MTKTTDTIHRYPKPAEPSLASTSRLEAPSFEALRTGAAPSPP